MLDRKNHISQISFIHANGFPPDTYKNVFKIIEQKYKINNFLLRPLLKNEKNYKTLKNWNLFYRDFLEYLENNKFKNNVGIGHSIGGNIILRTAILNPNYFSKIILLDPTLFTPLRNNLYKIILKLNLQNNFHPFLKHALNRKMKYKSYNEIFTSYRNKNIFKKIDDENLNQYIQSITKKSYDHINITYPKMWEYQIYKTGLIADDLIWKKIQNLKIPCLIIRAEDSNAFLDSSESKIRKLNKNIKFIKIENSTHLFPLEYPEKTANLILKELK